MISISDENVLIWHTKWSSLVNNELQRGRTQINSSGDYVGNEACDATFWVTKDNYFGWCINSSSPR